MVDAKNNYSMVEYDIFFDMEPRNIHKVLVSGDNVHNIR